MHHYLFDVEFAPPGRTSVRIQQMIRKRFLDALGAADITALHVVVSQSMGRVNELLDHEGPTEGGSSGCPVFSARLWEVIALHHKGGKIGMLKLKGLPGEYAASEGISTGSIRDAAHAA